MKLHTIHPTEGATHRRKIVVVDLVKQVVEEKKAKKLEVVTATNLVLKVDNYLYIVVYQKEVSLMQCLKQNMLLLI